MNLPTAYQFPFVFTLENLTLLENVIIFAADLKYSEKNRIMFERTLIPVYFPQSIHFFNVPFVNDSFNSLFDNLFPPPCTLR